MARFLPEKKFTTSLRRFCCTIPLSLGNRRSDNLSLFIHTWHNSCVKTYDIRCGGSSLAGVLIWGVCSDCICTESAGSRNTWHGSCGVNGLLHSLRLLPVERLGYRTAAANACVGTLWVGLLIHSSLFLGRLRREFMIRRRGKTSAEFYPPNSSHTAVVASRPSSLCGPLCQ